MINSRNMATPLSPLSPSGVNRRHIADDGISLSSPSPRKHANRSSDGENLAPSSANMAPPLSAKSYSSKTFSSPSRRRSPIENTPTAGTRPLTEEALRGNDYAMAAIDPEIKRSSAPYAPTHEDDTQSVVNSHVSGFPGMDDTCLSTFSAIPNVDMTRFANLGQSPTKSNRRPSPPTHPDEDSRSRPIGRETPSSPRRRDGDDLDASPTPRRPRHAQEHGNDTTNLLVDFTDHFAVPPYSSRRSPTRLNQSPLKSTTQPDLSKYLARNRTPSPAKQPLPPGTPGESRNLANLLDFDLPPAPTPRSVPSITARELESMKSQFLSQISSLSASLSGREAEVNSLKTAVTDAERRVGEAQEQVRDERAAKEGLQGEKEALEKRQGEMQDVLRQVKEEIMLSSREKDALLQRVQEADYKRDEAETKLVEAESKIEGFRISASTTTPRNQTNGGGGEQTAESGSNTQREVEAAVTKVAKELHGLYKSKHEAKVTALKKSYSDRWEKKVRELTNKVDDLTKENDELRLGRDATMTGVDPSLLSISQQKDQQQQQSLSFKNKDNNNEQVEKLTETQAELAQALSRTETLDTKVQHLESDLTSLRSSLQDTRSENGRLRDDLEASRSETAELMALSEELMTLSSSSSSSSSAAVASQQPSNDDGTKTSTSMTRGQAPSRNAFSRSISGSSASGLKAPGFGMTGGQSESRIGRGPGGAGISAPSANGTVTGRGGHVRERSGSSSGGAGSRSGILSNIERMGRGREN